MEEKEKETLRELLLKLNELDDKQLTVVYGVVSGMLLEKDFNKET